MIRLSGRLRAALVIGLQGIRSRKLRTFLSMMSLFLGVLAVVTVQAGAEIAERTMLANVELTMGKDGTHQMYLPGQDGVLPITMETLKGRTDAVALTGAQAIIGEPGVTAVNAGGVSFDQMANGPVPDMGMARGYVICDSRGCRQVGGDAGPVSPPGQAIEVRLVAMTGDVRQFKPFKDVSGDWLDFASTPSLSPRLVINKEAAKGFSRYRVPAELRIEGAIANATPRIIGVIDDGSDQPTVYLRAEELFNWYPIDKLGGQNGVGLELLLQPDTADLEQILRARLVAAGAPADQIVSQTVKARESIESSLTLLRLIFLGMAGLVLLIGVAGILNVGLATVGERVEEFALRRAVGTPRTLLAAIVLAETLLTGLLTAGAAIGVGMVAIRLIGPLVSGRGPFPQNLDFPWQAGLAGILAGLVAGLLGGLIPAIRAARIPIATVMRA
jgi:putative ABC transport system permease protein